MMKCHTTICDNEAVFRCHWTGDTIEYCEDCKNKMVGVSEALGMHVSVEFVDQKTYEEYDRRQP